MGDKTGSGNALKALAESQRKWDKLGQVLRKPLFSPKLLEAMRKPLLPPELLKALAASQELGKRFEAMRKTLNDQAFKVPNELSRGFAWVPRDPAAPREPPESEGGGTLPPGGSDGDDGDENTTNVIPKDSVDQMCARMRDEIAEVGASIGDRLDCADLLNTKTMKLSLAIGFLGSLVASSIVAAVDNWLFIETCYVRFMG